jgi:hypothetical protein
VRYVFAAEPIPGGIPYAVFRRADQTILVADPEWLRALTGCPELTPLAYELCGRLLTEIENPPGRHLRLAS